MNVTRQFIVYLKYYKLQIYFKNSTIVLSNHLSNNYKNIHMRTKVQIQNGVTLKIM